MASQTSALPDGSTLTKPAYTDSADIAVINTNMDKIVSNINAENQALANKTDYLFIDATSYAYDTKAGWDYAYGQIPDNFGGVVRINFNGGYYIVGTAYRQRSSWGSIIGHVNSNHIPFFYNVNSGTSTLDELALKSNIENIPKFITIEVASGATISYEARNNLRASLDCIGPARAIYIMRQSGNTGGIGIFKVASSAENFTITDNNNNGVLTFTNNMNATVYVYVTVYSGVLNPVT